jgi:hypothetical protein
MTVDKGQRNRLDIDEEERGHLHIHDDGDTIAISINPDCGGATLEERVEWLRMAMRWATDIMVKHTDDQLARMVEEGK